ncbi:MAG TPA: hypothetical protein PKO06_14585, partial [Candidatus Ozemobacteraceae bacterium]|nr:hypothetical protein [Candidatus Ozemobacteraceae bacterium]
CFFSQNDEMVEALSLYQALFRVRPDFCRLRFSDLLRSEVRCEKAGVCFTLPDATEMGGEPAAKIVIPWEKLAGPDFVWQDEQPRRRYPLRLTSSDGAWELRDFFAGEGFQPNWKLYDHQGNKRPMAWDGWRRCGFSRQGFWALVEGALWTAPQPMFPREHWQRWSWSDIQLVTQPDDHTFCVTLPTRILLVDASGKLLRVLLSHPPSRTRRRQTSFSGAWVVSETLYVSEIFETWGDGEISRLWAVPLPGGRPEAQK